VRGRLQTLACVSKSRRETTVDGMEYCISVETGSFPSEGCTWMLALISRCQICDRCWQMTDVQVSLVGSQ
jgi:hypothetical protein